MGYYCDLDALLDKRPQEANKRSDREIYIYFMTCNTIFEGLVRKTYRKEDIKSKYKKSHSAWKVIVLKFINTNVSTVCALSEFNSEVLKYF